MGFAKGSTHPTRFGTKADDLANAIVAYCEDYPKLVETIRADIKNGSRI
jgi:hypothetical protein